VPANPVLSARSQLALASRRKAPEAELNTRRAALKAAKLEQAVQRALSDAPPLTDEQAQRIVSLLMAGGGNDA
jgi:hypothetical protein